MIKNKVLEILVTSMMTSIGIGLAIILLALVIVGLLGGVIKETFYYLRSSQGFSTKILTSETAPANVLVTQE